MKPRNPDIRWIAALVVLAAFVAGCSPAKTRQLPKLYISAFGSVTAPVEPVDNGATISFVSGKGVINLVIGNTGDALLEIQKIEMTSTNAEMDLLPNLVGLSWPQAINPSDFKATDPTVLKLNVHFNPGANPDDHPTTLKITTNDERYAGGVFTFSIAPQEKVPELAVNPPNYVFLNATSTSTDQVDIVLSNSGSEALALGGIDFETPSSAYTIIGGRPNKDTIIDPNDTGAGNGPVTLTVEYRPQEPPDENRLVIQWGKVIETGVTCNKDETCRTNQDLCGKADRTCPYTCGNGRCMCTQDSECAAYVCDEGVDCGAICLTGVCRIPEHRYVDLSGKSQAGQLKVEYGDKAAGCVDFTTITEPGATCTKVIQLSNVAEGLVKVARPSTRISGTGDNPYTMKWYRLGATQPGETGCGPITGEEISENQFSLTGQNGPITVGITYTAPVGLAPNGELVVDYSAPFAGQEIVPLCGGTKKGELEVAPNPMDQNIVMFAPEPSRKATKTVVLMNKGNDVLELKGVSVEPVNPGVDPEGFKILNPPSGADLLMAVGALLPLTVEFDGNVFEIDENSDSIVLNGFLYVDYVDPLQSGDARATVHLNGWVNVKDVTLPVADAGSAADYAGSKVGTPFILDGSGSTGGTFEIPATSGYTWFISGKPASSKVFTNPHPGTAKVSVIPDVAGNYEFRLVVFSYDSDSTLSFFSDEAVVTVPVAP